ncbi:MAG: sigma-70 family RNA polymerase sigma factor [Bacteroidales bacterium]|nr:sigma-70 family RNA polymerase sigma factor [Bacteroidales bacterium]MCF8344560.1 sigma-70 family RNA polymerase sigma factor [Bacteroidales bacterium]MCF8350345.1 sigma-70 family RNA polymerase sigma factor [Bacteroidales bacterium]MCF8376477.1 sigma-70 family RNA polymerase sigma factor [Bacteroidales bacterium]
MLSFDVKAKEKKTAGVQTDIHKELIEQCKRGSSRAQYKLYQLYSGAMFNICMRMMNNRREEAEDLLQESFTMAFHRLDSFRYESTFGSWIKRIVINSCINEIKRRKAQLEFFDDIGNFENDADESTDLQEETYQATMSVQNVKKAMEQLPSGSQMIFSLYLLEGYDHREIAQILNTSESNSKSQYMRARKRVKEILKNMDHEKRYA